MPTRELGPARGVGVVFLLMGLFATVFAVFWMSGPLSGARDEDGAIQIFMIVFALAGLIPLGAGLFMVLLGIGILTGATHAEVDVRGGTLYATERLGLLRWRWRRRIEGVQRLTVGPALIGSARANQPQFPVFYAIVAACDGGKPLVVAPGYPRDLLVSLARELAHHIDAESSGLFDEDDVTVDVVEANEFAALQEVVVEKPEDSDATIEQRGDELTITLPPAGLRQGSKGLFFFALLWNGFLAVFTSLWFLPGELSGSMLGLIAFLALFWAIGIGLLLTAINMGRKRAIIDMVGDVLIVTEQSIFGTKQHELRADQIEAIRLGPSGTEVNNRPINELQVHRKEGKKLGLFSQRNDEELKWIASVLRDALGVER
jgi:hypothetical protein